MNPLIETKGKNDFLIWWVANQCAYNPDWKNDTPHYIVSEYNSRRGRSGRGRLWCAEGMPDSITVEWPDDDFGRYLTSNFGGIVIKKEDYKFICNMPGIITDLEMKINRSKLTNGGLPTMNPLDELNAKSEIRTYPPTLPRPPSDYFKSESDAIEFYLLHMGGEDQRRLLGIQRYHYVDKNRADEWKDRIMSKLNRSSQGFFEARQIVIGIHGGMVGRS